MSLLKSRSSKILKTIVRVIEKYDGKYNLKIIYYNFFWKKIRKQECLFPLLFYEN